MRTNSKEVRAKIRNHILECVYDENENQYKTFEQARDKLISEFDRVSGYNDNKVRIPNHQERFSDYLQGLPYRFEFRSEDIKDFLNGLGINPNNKEYSFDRMLHTYHYLIFREINYLAL
jgi:hypothetical protein